MLAPKTNRFDMQGPTCTMTSRGYRVSLGQSRRKGLSRARYANLWPRGNDSIRARLLVAHDEEHAEFRHRVALLVRKLRERFVIVHKTTDQLYYAMDLDALKRHEVEPLWPPCLGCRQLLAQPNRADGLNVKVSRLPVVGKLRVYSNTHWQQDSVQLAASARYGETITTGND